MEKLLKLEDNLVRSIGLANFNKSQIQDILENGNVVPAVNQGTIVIKIIKIFVWFCLILLDLVESHPYFNQNKLRQFLDNHNIKLVAYSPLGGPGNPNTSKIKKVIENETLIKIGRNHDKSAAQIALRWQVILDIF